MKRTDFSFDLPDALIAQEPRERGRSRMLVVTPGETPPFVHRSFADFPDLLDAGDVLVINDTRVIPARLMARPRGQMQRGIEVLLTRKRDDVTWEAWCKPARRVRPGDRLEFSESLSADVLEKEEGTVVVRFVGDLEEIERIGAPPLPPYIAREAARDSDRSAYQTVYANEKGSIAAPTAGLHFTPEILERLEQRGVEVIRVTLHVGIGTFKPVKVDDIAEHRMESEQYEISEAAAAALNRALASRKVITAVGTTSVRTLESAILEGNGVFQAGRNETRMFITPGFEFRVVDRLLTNFHLPESTLLMLVSAFAGVGLVREAYAEAIREHYFFYSYGDCMFIARRG
jgi:S-adenosylmethionine:tRNA ribosyltransferase-isomerase